MSTLNPEIDFTSVVGMATEVIEDAFDLSSINFSFICGSLAKARSLPAVTCRPNSDVDLFVCLKETPNEAEIERFRNGYFGMHDKLGRCPDTEYPGEVMSSARLFTAIGLASISKPSLRLEDPEVYDGIVWSGMLYSPKLIIHRFGPGLCKKSATGSAVVNNWCRALRDQLNGFNRYSADLALKNSIKYEQ